jgi:hypothetical protein
MSPPAHGHSGGAGDASWALGHREKVIDFGYRAVHEITAISKTVVQAYYGGAAFFNTTGSPGTLRELQFLRLAEMRCR